MTVIKSAKVHTAQERESDTPFQIKKESLRKRGRKKRRKHTLQAFRIVLCQTKREKERERERERERIGEKGRNRKFVESSRVHGIRIQTFSSLASLMWCVENEASATTFARGRAISCSKKLYNLEKTCQCTNVDLLRDSCSLRNSSHVHVRTTRPTHSFLLMYTAHTSYLQRCTFCFLLIYRIHTHFLSLCSHSPLFFFFFGLDARAKLCSSLAHPGVVVVSTSLEYSQSFNRICLLVVCLID